MESSQFAARVSSRAATVCGSVGVLLCPSELRFRYTDHMRRFIAGRSSSLLSIRAAIRTSSLVFVGEGDEKGRGRFASDARVQIQGRFRVEDVMAWLLSGDEGRGGRKDQIGAG